jgi:uncharacterized protein
MRALLSAVAAILVMAAPASAASTTLVINEVDYDQPSTDTAEFLEIKNVATSAINLDPYQLRFVNGANGLNYLTVNLPAVNLAGGDHYGVCANAATTANCDLDITPDTNLIQNGDPDGVVLETAAGAVDSLAYGPGPMTGVTETANATTDNSANAGQGLARVPDGCDTDNNAADFQRAAVTPGASNGGVACGGPPADSAPSVVSSDPAGGAIDVPLDAGLSVTFSEPVNVDATAFALTCDSSGGHGLTVTGGPTTFTLDPAGSFELGEACMLTVEADAVHDQDADDPPDTMAADAAIPFTTVAQEVRIRQIQGTSHLSPLMDELVSHVPGVVTARRANGFYMQDPEPDSDTDTSEGLFVFTSARPRDEIAVGSAVLVSGRVSEFRPANRPADLTVTEIVQPTVLVDGAGAAITPTLIGSGGRVPPGRIIDNDSLGDVEVSSLFDPDEDGIDFYESLEGMSVRVADPLVVGPTAAPNIGELPIVGDGGRFAGPRTARGGLLIEPDDFNPERMHLDDEVLKTLPATMPAANVSDRLSTVDAVVDYSFANFKLQVTSRPEVFSSGLEKEITEAPGPHELSVGSFNVENLTPNDSPAKYAALAHTLAVRMQAPDIVAVEEIQDNNGTAGGTGSPVTDASQTWNALIAAIQAAGGPVYDYRQIDPVAHQDGGAPGGNIRVGFLFRTDRGLEFVDRPGGTSTTATEVVDTPHGARLKYSPGRIEPNDAAWTASRKPLAGEFNWRGRTVIAVANHFASKGGDDPLFGHFQPPVRHTEIGPDGRHRQAALVNEFARDLLAADNQARLIVLGDINDFDFSETVRILESGGVMTSLYETLPPDERYSYVFEGNSQVLDQILVSPTLMHPAPVYDSVHMNAEFADQTSDHDPQVARLAVTGRRH